MNFDTTDYAPDDLGQTDTNFCTKKAHSLRSEALLSHSCKFCVAVKMRFIAIMNSWML